MRAAAAWAAVVVGASAFALDDDLLRPGDSVHTSLAAGGRKTVSFAGVAGTPLHLRAVADRATGLVPRLTLLDPAGAVAPAGDANPDAGRVARVDDFVLGTTGVWRVVVDSPTHGAFTLTTRAPPAESFDWSATGDAERTFDAAPGGNVSIDLAVAGDASLELVGPSGETLAKSAARHGRVRIAHGRLPDLGTYAIRVAGAVGEFSGRVTVRPAAPRRRGFRDVEAPPDVRGFAPGSATNQSLFTLDLDGTGFTSRQTVAVVKDGVVIAIADVRTGPAQGATALLDLGDVAPGTYSLEIRRPGHPSTPVPGDFAVTNLAPRIVTTDAGAAPNTGEFPVEVVGTGFDADAQVVVRPTAGGDPLTVTVAQRKGHESLVASVTPPPYFTGTCDLEVRDPAGDAGVLPGAIDVLGYRAAPAAVFTAGDSSPLAVDGAAFDATRDHALAALRGQAGAAKFVLADSATLAPLDTLDISADDLGGGVFDEVQASYDPGSDTFALCLTTSAAPTRAFVRIVSASDIHHTVAERDLAAATAQAVSRVHAAPNRGVGGYLVVWDEFEEQFGARIWATSVDAAGKFASAAPSLVEWDAPGDIGFPTAAYQRDGKFVVAWAGLSEDRLAYAIRLQFTDAAGVSLTGTAARVAATSRKWTSAARPGLAVNRADGSTLLTYWYGDGSIYRPAARGIAADTGAPLVTSLLDADLDFDGGVTAGAVWNTERSEFVVVTAGYDSRIAVHRVAANGTLIPTARPELYEGTSAAPYGGAWEGTLGLLRVSDAVEDGLFDKKSTTLHALAGPLR